MSRVYDNWESVLNREKHVLGTSHSNGDAASCLDGEILPESCLEIYSFAELKSATRNFKPDLVLGVGGSGIVFKGWIGTGMRVAIKNSNPETTLGLKEWQSELKFLGRLSHPNLVKLLGYCWEDKHQFLVYEFMQKGSLESHLFGRQASIEPLSWDLRLKVAIGAARGLAFLHTSYNQVIFRVFKASNILLDENYNAKITDFGLTTILRPFGLLPSVHVAPEYIGTGHLCLKSDVYSFGVVLIEILTGLTALDMSRPSRKINLVDWVKPLLNHKHKFLSVMDPRIAGQFSSKAAQQAAQLAHRCLELEPRNRPSMNEVVSALEQILAVEKSKESPNMQDKNKVDSKMPVIVNTPESASAVQNAANQG